MSLSKHRLLLRGIDTNPPDAANYTKNVITYSDSWASNLNSLDDDDDTAPGGSSRGSEAHERCLRSTLVPCMWLRNRDLEETEVGRAQTALGVSMDFIGTDVEVQIRADDPPDCASDPWSLGYWWADNGTESDEVTHIGPPPSTGNPRITIAAHHTTPLILTNRTQGEDLPVVHTLDIYPSVISKPSSDLTCPDPPNFFVDYAVVTLAPYSPVTPLIDFLAVPSEDRGWIRYEGDWVVREAEGNSYLRAAFGGDVTETTHEGDSFNFTFFGTSLRVYAIVLDAQSAEFAVSVDDAEPEEQTVGWPEHANLSRRDYDPTLIRISNNSNSSSDPDSAFQISNLADSALHTVSVSLVRFVEPSTPGPDPRFRVYGVVYTPSFDCIGTGEQLIAVWNATEHAKIQPDAASQVIGSMVLGVVLLFLISVAGLVLYRCIRRRGTRRVTLDTETSLTAIPLEYTMRAGNPYKRHGRSARTHTANTTGEDTTYESVVPPGSRSHQLRPQVRIGDAQERGSDAGSIVSSEETTRSEGLRNAIRALTDRDRGKDRPPSYT